MKKILLVFGLISSTVFAQDCTKIFISEYIEGRSNNKALEIYNPTDSPINLAEYFVARYSNGASSATVENAVQLSGIIAPRSVYVAVLDKRVLSGTGNEAPIWPDLIAKADGFYSPVYTTSNAFYWNGNDAVLLAKGTLPATSTADVTTSSGFQIVDIFGKIGENPGPDSAWSSEAPYNNNTGRWITREYHMQRKSSIGKGVITPVTSFNPLAEYDTIYTQHIVSGTTDTVGDFNTLGSHDCFCNSLSVESKINTNVSVYPNPSSDGTVFIQNASEVNEVIVNNALGQQIAFISSKENETIRVRLGEDRGVFILRIKMNNGSIVTKRVVSK